jgi:hypothetical protein
MEGTLGSVSTCWRKLLLSVMAADRSYVEFYDFYSVSPEYFAYPRIALEYGKPDAYGMKSS